VCPKNYRPLIRAFDISEPDVYSRYTKIGVCMEELDLRKKERKTFCIIQWRELHPKSVPQKFLASNQGPSIFPSPMFIQDIQK
jgi:hypothetical protein